MYQLKSLVDTIVAISTPTGQGGIGIVRLSGRQSVDIADKLFIAKNGNRPSSFKNFAARYGNVVNTKCNETIDEALMTVMRAPKSYTKEEEGSKK